MNGAPALLAVGYGATILSLMELPAARKILELFAPPGRMAFTNYLLQSLVCGLVFFGYGLGQFGHMAFAPAFVLGVAIYVAQIIASIWNAAAHEKTEGRSVCLLNVFLPVGAQRPHKEQSL